MRQIYLRGRNLPRYIVLGRDNSALRSPAGRLRTWSSDDEAAKAADGLTEAAGRTV